MGNITGPILELQVKLEEEMTGLTVDRGSDHSMMRQLYLQLREKILSGQLRAGFRLPSSRNLAGQLQISRNVVLEAYDLLGAEGFLVSKRGSGTFVADGATMDRIEPPHVPELQPVTMGYESRDGVINFRAGTPDLKAFPQKLWLRMLREVFETPMAEILAYGHPEGRRELREVISSYLLRNRELVCHPDQVVITGGTTQAIGLACRLLIKRSQDVILEDPITRDIQRIVLQYGAKITPVPVDSDGIRTNCLPDSLTPSCIYVTPSHQFPIGGTLPIQRRIELIQFATERDAYIIEDDYDSEFRFDGPVLSSLRSLCPDRVIYIGTFSKTLCPAIRIGYMVLPPDLIAKGRRHKWQSDLHNEVTSQLALARFMEQGHYIRHLARMRIHYRNRRKVLVESLQDCFGSNVQILGSATGLHLVAQFSNRSFTEEDFKKMEMIGARFYPVTHHAIESAFHHKGKLLIGYGNLSREEIRKGVRILADYLGQNH